ncbi:MAG: class I SAM-dependent methyltransferase [Candidatus Dadabacteria bacterium]|nr:MAG: class I SAM-dependent methyltransferase [Candidatus Dadabacteria bacterium]
MVLPYSKLKTFYDHFGKKQDKQGFYEDPALEQLVSFSEFKEAHSVFEFGCGTGRFAQRLLECELPADATYYGIDLSTVMVSLARKKLAHYSGRARIEQSEGEIQFPLEDHSVERVVSTYVLDLLSNQDIQKFLAEAHRVLKKDGKLCLASLTHGRSLFSKLVSTSWSVVSFIYPSLVGGCRPLLLTEHFDHSLWKILQHTVVSPYGIPSEIIVAVPKYS